MTRQEERDRWSVLRLVLSGLKRVGTWLRSRINRLDERNGGRLSPAAAGWITALACLLLMIPMLFLPPCRGMSDDGSFAQVMNPMGIYHLEDTAQNNYINYFVRDYMIQTPQSGIFAGKWSARLPVIAAAKWLDLLFYHDGNFDLRFLAFFYCLLFLPALALLVKRAASLVERFSERVAVAFAGLVLFADVAYLSYFNSFYPEPLEYILFLFCAGAAFGLAKEGHDFRHLILFAGASFLLTETRQQCAAIGVLAGIFCVRALFLRKDIRWRVGCACAALLLFFSTMLSAAFVPSDFTLSSKYHAMTRGVLLESSNPDATLTQMGINGSYAVLADTNANDSYPLVNPSDPSLQQGFYDRYDTPKILFYYLGHPRSLLSLLDIASGSSADVRRSMSGNFEKSAGLPPMAKSLFWSAWSSFKSRSQPRTVGYAVLLLIAAVLLFRPKGRRKTRENPRASVGLNALLFLFLAGLSQAIVTVVESGDAELPQHLFLYSVSIDLLLYFCFAQILHKLRVL